MKLFPVVFVVLAYATIGFASEDPLDHTITKCLDHIGIHDITDLSDEQSYCLLGCILQDFKLVGENGQLLDNGVENLIQNLPHEYAEDLPTMVAYLEKVKPDLISANNTCHAGEIVSGIVAELFFGL